MDLTMTAVEAAGVWSGLLILLLVGLAFRVVANRRRHRVLFGDGGVQQMTVATRAFGNAAEYIPVGIGALILLALVGCAPWVIHVLGGVFLAGRLIHGVGLSHGRGPGPSRMIGMVLTLLVLIVAAGMLVVCPLLP
ncbi:MAPEG family protein [Brevundimonas sp.]|uniref:MAPEG family protein n=1 Tax=Brevundimonas sp. TaxID=1871086 RepID=UPI002D5B0862|nr:MAPEG family protein [Brevundimonas sp.]HYC69182.1 MAPEG family protein [Brevundimonas sp.]